MAITDIVAFVRGENIVSKQTSWHSRSVIVLIGEIDSVARCFSQSRIAREPFRDTNARSGRNLSRRVERYAIAYIASTLCTITLAREE